jgi:plastocyanin
MYSELLGAQVMEADFQVSITHVAATTATAGNSSLSLSSYGSVDQTPATRAISVYAFPAGKNRFFPDQIIVNQGDTVDLTFISNDSEAHTLTFGPPYNFQINATVPGLIDHFTKSAFTTNGTNNSPGVTVTGTPGNVTATGSFVAKYAGIYEFYCAYHVELGMFGYLVVLPNLAYSGSGSVSGSQEAANSSEAQVTIEPGSGSETGPLYFSPSSITVVIGVNNTVVWVNDDTSPHTVTSDTGVFNSGNLSPGQTFQFTFTQPGNYAYHCSYHPWMTGNVTVESG